MQLPWRGAGGEQRRLSSGPALTHRCGSRPRPKHKPLDDVAFCTPGRYPGYIHWLAQIITRRWASLEGSRLWPRTPAQAITAHARMCVPRAAVMPMAPSRRSTGDRAGVGWEGDGGQSLVILKGKGAESLVTLKGKGAESLMKREGGNPL